MKGFQNRTYAEKLRLRIWGLWGLLLALVALMVVVGVTGGADSRYMTPLASNVSRLVIFGGMGLAVARIVHNKRLLADGIRRREQMDRELEERRQYLHDKSGGVVLDILLVLLLFLNAGAAAYNMPAFYTAFAVLVTAVCLKAGAYWIYSRR
ncbi:hypothetical protein D7X94_04065 [Acutalibacter sp. 1XD8-33]|uniref:hypothetical protein n=1 Tax=Acutalibacter sp. 1XD8-33 TaxID=2320081 RepID=UPI000EA37A49|nr:hypothetical protein [Acutalibacter sp. 1XD8-33]RKJ41471.1 hypothetical protein D7X94_04065 [Acutalibacter sp. 1XD8-33]